MKRRASSKMLSFAIMFICLISAPTVSLILSISFARAESFPASQLEVNSLEYTTNSKYLYNDNEKIIQFNRSISIQRAFPSNGYINITESWKTNYSYYIYAYNQQYNYTINESDNSKADLGNLPLFLAGIWTQRFPNNNTLQNVTLDEMSIITRVQVTGTPRITGKSKIFATSLGQRTAYEVEIKGTFEQNCAT